MPRPTRAVAVLLVGLALGPAPGCSGPPQDLRGPAPEVGQVYHSELTVTVTDGTLTLTAGGASETARIDLVVRGEYEDEIRAVAGGRVTGVRTRVLAERGTETVRAGGQADTRTDPSPLEGETIDSDLAGEAWTHRLVGKTPTERQAAELGTFPPPRSAADWFPEGKVKPGHSWDVDARELTRLFGSDLRIESGSWRMTFEKTVTAGGEPCARIAELIDVTGRMRNPEGGSAAVALKASGTTTRSLPRGFDLTTTLTGTVTLTAPVTEGGVRGEVTIRGPVTAEKKTSRK